MKLERFLGLFVIFSSSLLFSQNKYDVCVFMNPYFRGTKALYSSPNGKIAKMLQHNFDDEDYIGFEILNKNDSMFYVRAYYEINGTIGKGWIKKDENIGIYSRAYNQSLNLYSYPDEKSKIKYTFKEYNPQMYIVTDCSAKWLKVQINIKGKKHIGWLSPNMQCCNVYSTCS